jgi:cyclophilin family peptidyl-prolyl cis-trans isomerase/HEAT repeat protein
MKYLSIVLLCAVMVGVTGTVAAAENIFQDKVLRQVYTLQNARDAEGLKVYLTDKNPVYRRAAALAYASIQAPGSVDILAQFMKDEDEAVRAAAAYAMGQVGNKTAENILIDSFAIEQSIGVKRNILEAIGKCGSEKGLAFIVNLGIEKNPPELLTGQALGIYRFALQNIVSPQGTALAFELVKQELSDRARLLAAHYLSRAKGIDLTSFHEQAIRCFDTASDKYTRMALAYAMGKAQNPTVLERLKTIISFDPDYRVRVNAARALGNFDYAAVKETFFTLLKDPKINVHVAVTISEYFLQKGKEIDAMPYFELAKQSPNPRVRANMLTAALAFPGNAQDKEKISAWIIDSYGKAGGIYEKADILSALSGDPRNYKFVESRVFSDDGKYPILSTTGLGALAAMCTSTSVKTDEAMLKTFAGIFKKAMESGDISMMTSSAGILRDPEVNLKRFFTDTAFITAALDKCKLPQDFESWVEIKKTVDFYKNAGESKPVPSLKNLPIDWDLVMSISPEQCIVVKTTRGNFTIQLMVNNSPGSVSNFVRLIKENFYKNGVFHRVVPNFVIQDGCPKGDGSGGPSYTIGSEFGPIYYEEGSVGMASSGKDTEGSQWFVTHSPTPHLDGKYTIFARVISGMSVVHQIEVGDKILGFEIR